MTRRTIEQFGLPVISVVMAFLLWVYVVGQKEMEWTFSLPVSVNVHSNDVLAAAQPEHVSVILSGPRRELDRIPGETIAVRLVLIDDQPGEYVRGILPSMVTGLPSGVRIIRIEPSEVRVKLDEIVEVRNRVIPKFRAPADTRYVVTGEVEVSPRTVDLRGTREALGRIDGVATDSIPVEGPPGKRSLFVGIDVPGNVKALPQTVSVSYEIGLRVDTTRNRSGQR